MLYPLSYGGMAEASRPADHVSRDGAIRTGNLGGVMTGAPRCRYLLEVGLFVEHVFDILTGRCLLGVALAAVAAVQPECDLVCLV